VVDSFAATGLVQAAMNAAVLPLLVAAFRSPLAANAQPYTEQQNAKAIEGFQSGVLVMR
jgi:hypothetical protein